MMAIAAVAVVKSRNGNGTRGSLVDGSLLKKWSEGEVEQKRRRSRLTRRDEERAPYCRKGAAGSRVATVRFTNESERMV